MSHYLLVTWDGAGNVPPELSVLRDLADRGHRISVLGDPTLRTEAEALGADFRPWVAAPHQKSRAPEDHLIRDFEAKTPPQLIARLSDRLVATPAGVQAAKRSPRSGSWNRMCCWSAGCCSDPRSPARWQAFRWPPYWGTSTGSRLGACRRSGRAGNRCSGALGRVRDAAVNRLATHLWNRALPEVNGARAAHGLAPLADLWSQPDRAAQVLVLTSPAFDFAGELPRNVRYTGPQLEDPIWVEPWEPPPARIRPCSCRSVRRCRTSSRYCAGSSPRWQRFRCARLSRPATPSTRPTCPHRDISKWCARRHTERCWLRRPQSSTTAVTER